jgi:uncharacterized protein YbbC (DUF1343 family)
VVSVGRGTDSPFEIFGHPKYLIGSYAFTPHGMPGAKHPQYEGETCCGFHISGYDQDTGFIYKRLQLMWLIQAYQVLNGWTSFFNSYFDKLAGNSSLRQQIIAGKSEEEIRASWKNGIETFNKIRKKYLLYPDFE